MKKVLITGANGFIGSSLVKKFIANGIEVVAVDVNFRTTNLRPSSQLTIIESSVDASLSHLLPPGVYDACYHFAWRGINGKEKENPMIQLDNIQMAMACADICRQLNISKMLCAGTVAENAVYSLPHLDSVNGGMMYGTAKHACHLMLETYCKHIGVSCVWMQFSNIYGIGNRTGNLVSYTLENILKGKDATFGPAQQPYDFIYIDDLIEAAYRLGVSGNAMQDMYFIGSGSPRFLHEYLNHIGQLVGSPELIKIGFRDYDGIRYDFSMFDTTSLHRDIGDYVSTPFDDGIRKTIDWIKRTDGQ